MCQVLGHTSQGSSLQLSHPHCPIHTCDQRNALTQCSIRGLRHHDSSTQGLGFDGGWKSSLQGLGFNKNTHHDVHPPLDWHNVCTYQTNKGMKEQVSHIKSKVVLVVYIHTYIHTYYCNIQAIPKQKAVETNRGAQFPYTP